MSTGLKQRILERARALGFLKVGVAPAEPPAHADALRIWLEQGYHGALDYMAKSPERRMDPRVYWPECRSILAVSVPYAGAVPDPAPGPLEGRIARYARGPDYHDLLKPHLQRLGRFIEELRPGSRTIAVVDTSAVLERAHAARAGLGWSARNAMLLSRDVGSYTLLGFVLLDFELEPDLPSPSYCGSCRRCQDACPTGAIVGPRVVDARRCISTLTIELKGPIPLEHRPHLEGWLFGCDICQEVCPWVQKAGSPAHTGPLQLDPSQATVGLEVLVETDDAGFAARFRKTPLKRSRRTGLARTAMVLLGNSPERARAVSLLARGLLDPSPLVRRHAAWGLGQQAGAAARQALDSARRTEADPAVLEELEQALERTG